MEHPRRPGCDAAVGWRTFPGMAGTAGRGSHAGSELIPAASSARLARPPCRPRRLSAALPTPHGSPAPSREPGLQPPPGPAADSPDGRREGLLARGAEQERLEKCQSQGQQAASIHLGDPAWRRRRGCTLRPEDRAGAPTSTGGRVGRGGQGTGGAGQGTGRGGQGTGRGGWGWADGLSSPWWPLRA